MGQVIGGLAHVVGSAVANLPAQQVSDMRAALNSAAGSAAVRFALAGINPTVVLGSGGVDALIHQVQSALAGPGSPSDGRP